MRSRVGLAGLLAAGLLAMVGPSTVAGASSATTRPAVPVGAAEDAVGEVSGLDVAVTPGTTTVETDAVTVQGTYTCRDTGAAHQVSVGLTLNQGVRNGFAATDVDCEVTAGSWTVKVPVALDDNAVINAAASISDGTSQAHDTALLRRHTRFLDADPTYTITDAGAAVVTGHYSCSDKGTAAIEVTVQQVVDGHAVDGLAQQNVNCPATKAPYMATVTAAPDPATEADTTYTHGKPADAESRIVMLNGLLDSLNAVVISATRIVEARTTTGR